MLIDWFTVGAQALNFVILVWLMKRFLYRPVLRAIDAREKRIARELADAAAAQADAKHERDEYRGKLDDLQGRRAALMNEAKEEARSERQRLLEEARASADTLHAKRRETLRAEARQLNQALGRRAQEEVFAIARKALADLAATTLEERMADAFVRRVRELDPQARARLGRALEGAAGGALVRSAFELPEAQRSAIRSALHETLSAELRVRFECAPELVGGVELVANGHKVAWNIADYLSSLEEGVAELLKGDSDVEAPIARASERPGTEPPQVAPQPALRTQSTRTQPERTQPERSQPERSQPEAKRP